MPRFDCLRFESLPDILVSVPSLSLLRRLIKSAWLFAALLFAMQQASAQASPSAESIENSGRLILVLPFDNHTGQQSLAWIGASFPDTLNQRLASAGFLPISHDDLQYALDHLGLPPDFRPTRATTIRIARTLDANYVIIGSYNVNNGRISAQAQVLNINRLRMSHPLQDSSELARLFDVENAIAWKVAHNILPDFAVAEQTFLSAQAVPLSAFEDYIRGINAATPDEGIKRLQEAVRLAPGYSAALLALGKAQYANRDFDSAAATLNKIPHADHRALEANFYLGLARFNSGQYADAASAFAFVASRLPLPEVVNNQGVAEARQGHNAVPLFRRASAADPNDPDYHYNLAVSLYRQGDFTGAASEVDQTLRLRPADTEAAQLKVSIATGKRPGATTEAKAADPSAFDPLERIRRSYSEASFRQAAFEIDQMRAMRMATLSKDEQARQYSQLGRDYLGQGLIPEAEQQFQFALAANPSSAEAHAGLAQVRERTGNAQQARAEAETSLRLQPNAPAYLVLAHLEYQANQLDAAAADVSNALRIDPKDSAALGMKQALQARGKTLP